MSPTFAGHLPYFTIGPWELGPITIQSFGLMVAIGVWIAHERALTRSERVGLSKDRMRSLLAYLLIVGFIGGHVFDEIFYRPEELLAAPWKLLWIPGSLSSYGGIAGALIGLVIWTVRHRPEEGVGPYADVAAFVLPSGWFFGRVGCALVHDHPGALTDFPLAVDFGAHGPGGVRHDLGVYEALWWIVILAVFALVDRRRGRSADGLWLALLPLIYAPVRFGLDFLRASPNEGGDARYLGLTPAQYASIAAFVAGLYFLRRWNHLRSAQRDLTPRDLPPATDRYSSA
jgi:phosphatidylglycerol---prolipoprotein diacylglyceryl transferase